MGDMKTTFDDAVMGPPAPGGDHQGLSGGFPIADAGPGGKGLVSSPYDNGICDVPGGKETASRELGTTPNLWDTKDAPAGQPTGMSSMDIINEHIDGDQTFKTQKQ